MKTKASPKKNIEDIYPLSPMQQGMLFHALLEPDSPTYNEQMFFKLSGDLNLDHFRSALSKLVQRHAVLRTAFIYKKSDKLLQAVRKTIDLPLFVLDWQDLSPQKQSLKFKELLDHDRKAGFNLSKAPLLRIHLIHLAANKWQVLWSNHHIILDGWSNPVLLKELFIIYENMLKGYDVSLPPARPFKEYITWLNKQDKQHADSYWKNLLMNVTGPTPLNVDKLPNPRTHADRYGKQSIRLNKDDSLLLFNMAREEGLTINTVVQGAWSLLLHHYSRENDVIFGATVSGRPASIPDVQNMVGLFINTLPMRISIQAEQFTTDWLHDIQKQGVMLRDFEYSSLADVQKQSGMESGALFESILVFENYPVEEEMGKNKTSLSLTDFGVYEQTNFPLTLLVGANKEIIIDASYQPTRFSDQAVIDILKHLKSILLSFASHPRYKVGQHTIYNQDDLKNILESWPAPYTQYDETAIIPVQFEKQVEKTPDHPALFFEGRHLTYQQMNLAVNRVAHHLMRLGVQPDQRVAVYMERSLEMVIALYAIIKVGAAYVPIDPTNPKDRIRFMLEDSYPDLILTQKVFQKDQNLSGHNIFVLDMQNLPDEKDSDPRVEISPKQAAYMIYTSGSTGRPKGAILTHEAIRNRLQWMQDTFLLTENDRVLQKTPYTFDVSVWEFFWPLMHGAMLVIAKPEGHKDTTYLVKTILDEQITTMHFVPPMLQVFLEVANVSACSSLKRVICSGEALPYDLKERFYQKLEHTELHNLYGPTEAAVDVTWYACPHESPYSLLPIGKAISNTPIYILDENLRPVPIGVPGELFIGGIQLARGYHNRPALTAEKFIPDPYSDVAGARMYRTGDLVHRLPDGNIDYLSRIDFQLKIRGFRIELGEIEYRLSALPSIREAVVTVYEPQPGNKQLTAHIIPVTPDSEIDVSEIKEALLLYLPDYMVPAFIIPMTSFPLTPNGKIDRKALPKPNAVDNDAREYVAPGNEIEQKIQEIWQDLLNVSPIGIHNDFFRLGGHSILATRLVTRFRQNFKVELPLSAVFEARTIARQALLVEMEQARGNRPQLPELTIISRDGDLPVSLPQQRLWFIDQFNPGTTAYNISLSLLIKGKPDIALLEKSIQMVIDRHEILRTVFVNKNGMPFQKIEPTFEFKLESESLMSGAETAVIREQTAAMATTSFDLSRLPLLRMKIVQLAEERFLLTGAIHHIISDGQSMPVFIEETMNYYRQLQEGREIEIAPLPFQYADYAAWQREWLSGYVLEQHIAYWKEHIGLQPETLELPTDFPRPAVQTFNGRRFDFNLDAGQTARLVHFIRQKGVTLYMALMTVFQVLLHRYSRQNTILVGSPVAGRLLEEANALIGFFVNTLVIKGEFNGNITFNDLLKNFRRSVLEAHAHQSLPFEQLVDLLQPERDMAHPPLFQAALIVQNAQNNQIETAGLIFEEIIPEAVVAKVDLSLYVLEDADKLRFGLEYNSDLFRPETIEGMAAHFTRLLTAMLDNAAIKIDKAPMMPDEEQHRLQNELAFKEGDSLPHQTVVDAFSEQCRQHPGQAALVMDETSISYDELNVLSDRIAAHLLNSGISNDEIVGICMTRGTEMIIAMLAILKAGGAYLPLDPTYPADRLRYMAADSGTKNILINADSLPHVQDVFPESIQRMDIASLLENDPKDISQPPVIVPGQLAYVIYTSGSTGNPKGVLLQHKGLVNLAHEQQKTFHINPDSRVLQFASLSFDAATWECVMALLNGASLYLIDSETQTAVDRLQGFIIDKRITTITLPPSVLSLFDDREMPDLKTIITAGEKCPQTLVKRFQPGRQMVNAYGPTETTVCACWYQTDASEDQDPPIGFPLGGFDLHVVDEHLQLVPPGVPGELCIGGSGLARGYLNRPDLTAQKFIVHPFAADDRRLYRSGDLVKRRYDGALEFLGRIDRQVKLRGFRIELGEIQSAIRQTDGVRDAYVTVRQEAASDPRLCAYLVYEGDVGIIREKLAERLPAYMIPGAYVVLDALPLTSNGKVDEKALPAPEQSRDILQNEFVAPRNDQEKQLAAIVGDLLNLDQVGIHDNFFDLGGHSLLATRFIAQLREQFSVEMPLRILFENPTVEGIALAMNGPDVRKIDADEPALEAMDRDDMDDDDSLLEAMSDLSDDELNALLNEDEDEDGYDE